MPDELLTVAEIAATLKLNPQTVRNMIDRGDLPAVRVGQRRVRVLRSDLDAFLAEGRRLTTKTPTRVAYNDAVGNASKALRGSNLAASSSALRDVALKALALALEIEAI